MITDEELEEGLRSLRYQRRPAPPLDQVLHRGRRRVRRRRGIKTALALSAVAAGVGLTFVGPGDPAPDIVATRPPGGHTLEEVAASRPFGKNLRNLAVGPDGALWSAWLGQGIYSFDAKMQVTRSVEGLEPGVLSPAGGGIALADDGSIVAAGTSSSDELDGHGEALLVPTLRTIAPDGTMSTLAVLPGEGPPTLPPRIADGRVFVPVNDRVVSVRLDDGGTEASAPLDGGVRDFTVDGGIVWAATGASLYQLAADDLAERKVERRPANSVVVTGGVAWVLGEAGGDARRFDGQAATARGAWGDIFDLEPGDEILWAYAQKRAAAVGRAGGGTGIAALAAFDAHSGDIVAWRSVGRVYGALAAKGTTAWQQDGLAGGIIRRYELRRLEKPDGTRAPDSAESPAAGGRDASTSRAGAPGRHAVSCPSGSSTALYEPTQGTYTVYLKAVDVEKRRVSFDVIQWLSGDDARTAYRKDNPQDRDGPPNDYYIVNESPRTYTAGVSSNVAVNLVRLAQDGNADLDRGTFEELPAYLHLGPEGAVSDAVASDTPFWVKLRNSQVVEICEQYRP